MGFQIFNENQPMSFESAPKPEVIKVLAVRPDAFVDKENCSQKNVAVTPLCPTTTAEPMVVSTASQALPLAPNDVEMGDENAGWVTTVYSLFHANSCSNISF